MLSSFSFPKERRIYKHSEYLRIKAEGTKGISTSHFLLVFSVNPDPGGLRKSRLGLVVTKKLGVAVLRNRVKRICREAFRTLRGSGFLPDGVDLLVIAKRGAETLSPEAVQKEWLLAKANGGSSKKRPVKP